MAAEIDPVILDLIARDGAYRARVQGTADIADKAFTRQERGAQRLERQMLKSSTAISNSFRTLAGSLATYFTGRELTGLIDSFTRLQNNLKVAGLEGQNLANVQQSLIDISSRYGASVEGLSGVFLKASLAQKELGASASDIIRLNEIIAASLKVTGTSAQEAQGALLQLGQALGSGVVRAEEFNSILEGALPLAQAAARGIDGYGGSVAKLRAAVADGKITSQQFFEGVLKGGVQTLADAEKAALTLSGAFEALKSRLTIYVGEGAKANGVTQALATGLGLLADNIDSVITSLAVIAAFLGVKYVAAAAGATAGNIAFAGSATGSAAAMGLLGAASFAAQARLVGAATSMEAATFAARGLWAALAGPAGVAIAVTALVAGLAYAASSLHSTAEAARELERASSEADATLNSYIDKLKKAGVSTDELGRISEIAAGKVDGLADSYNKASVEAHRLATEASKATIELLKQQAAIAQASKTRQAQLEREVRDQDRARTVTAGGIVIQTRPVNSVKINELNRQIAEEERLQARTDAAQEAILLAGSKGIDLTGGGPGSPAPTKTKKTKTRKGPKDRTDELAARASQEVYNLEIEQLRAQAEAATNTEDRADFERQILAKERDARNADIDAAVKAGDLTKEQAAAQREILDKLYGRRDAEAKNGEIVVEATKSLYTEQVERDKRLDDFRNEQDLRETRYRAEQDALRDQFDLARTDDDRRRIALQILDAEDAYLRSKLEAVVANQDLADAVRRQAQVELDALNSSAADRRAVVERANQGALGRYIDDITDTKARAEEATVRQLRAVNEGITDALTSQLGIKNQFVKDLFSIFLDQVIFQPLAESLRNGGKGGGFGGFIGSLIGSLVGIPGRASGGPVSAGRLYRINESAGSGQPEYFQPANSGNIIPLGRVNQMAARAAAGQAGGVTTVRLELSGDIDARIQQKSAGVAIEVVRAAAPGLTERAVNETFRRSSRPTI